MWCRLLIKTVKTKRVSTIKRNQMRDRKERERERERERESPHPEEDVKN